MDGWYMTLPRNRRGRLSGNEKMTYGGEPMSDAPFFELLYTNDDFCKELGRCALSCSRLEASLINLLTKNNIEPRKSAPLGALILQAKESNLINSQMLTVLQELKEQRNHMIHKLYSLFSGLAEETLLPRSDLIDSDVWTYIDYASQLTENLQSIGDIFMERQHV